MLKFIVNFNLQNLQIENMSQLDIKIGPKIKAFRRQLGLQANKLSEELGISPSYLNLIESGKRKIDGDLLLKVCDKLKIELSDLTSKTDLNLENTISEILDDKLFEDLDILGPEVKDLVGTNPKIGRALVRLGDILKKKDHELINKIEKVNMLNLITTNETYFYREFKQIESLVSLVKEFNSPVSILCAPSSTGEEPYSIVIALLESGIKASHISVLGIDINSDAISKSQEAIYSQRHVRNLSFEILEKYFWKHI